MKFLPRVYRELQTTRQIIVPATAAYAADFYLRGRFRFEYDAGIIIHTLARVRSILISD